jgi:hypothetical protein
MVVVIVVEVLSNTLQDALFSSIVFIDGLICSTAAILLIMLI